MDEFIFDYLKGAKKNFSDLGDEVISSLTSLSKKYQLIGFISSVYKFSDEERLKELKIIQKVSVAKNLIMKHDLKNICNQFNKKNINYCILKGPALVHAGIYKKGVRFFRDLDILVSRSDLKLAFKTLRQTGFRYENKLSNDDCNVLGNKHHLPIMINDNGTYLELHHRATSRKNYLNCPISENILEDKIFHNGMYIPCTDALIGHSLYHGLVHHKGPIGPITLFDLKEISKKFNIELDRSNKYLTSLGLENKANQIENLFINVSEGVYSNNFSQKLDYIDKNIALKHQLDTRICVFNLRELIDKIGNDFFNNKIEYTEFKYQIKRSDIKFILFYGLELLGSIRRKIKFF
tara:strand:+ start:442 stop:1491 length:1050 start_codon:yes stop_codon:yes gene_type:complete